MQSSEQTFFIMASDSPPSCTRLVAFNVMTGDADTVAGEDLTRLEEGDITDEQFLDVDNALDPVMDDLETSFFLLVVKDTELSILLPITKGANHNLCEQQLARRDLVIIESHIRQ